MTSLLGQKSFLDLFPAPEFLLLSTTGIIITDLDTKMVTLRREVMGDGFKLALAHKVDNPPGAIVSGSIAEQSKLADVLKELSSRYGIRYTHAIVPEERAYLFTATIGPVPQEGMRDAVAFIIEENVPVSLAESVFDFEVVSENEITGELKVAVSVVPQSAVASYVEVFESAGITPISFDLESQALARAVIQHGDRRPQLIINLSLNRTGFYVVEEEVVQFSTTAAYGFGPDDSYTHLGDLKAEMRKVFAFWNARTDKAGKPGKKIERALISGLGGSRADFVEKLMGESEVPYALADVWVNMSPSRSHVSEMPFDQALDFASAIGLVLPHAR